MRLAAAYALLLPLVESIRYVVVDGEAYPLLNEKLTVDMILAEKSANFEIENLPIGFWQRQSREDLIKLIKHYSIGQVLENFTKIGYVMEGKELLFGKDKSFLLFTDVEPQIQGPILKTVIDQSKPLDIFDLSDACFNDWADDAVSLLKLEEVLSKLDGNKLFKIAKNYASKLKGVLGNGIPDVFGVLLQQAMRIYITQLLANEGLSFDSEQIDDLLGVLLLKRDNIVEGLLQWGLMNKPPSGSLMKLLLGRFRRMEYKKVEGNLSMALEFLLFAWNDRQEIPVLVGELIDRHGVGSLGDGDWYMLSKIGNPIDFAPLILAGLILGKLNFAMIQDGELFQNILKRDPVTKAISSKAILDNLIFYQKTFSWLSVYAPVSLPAEVVKAIIELNSAASREFMLRRLVSDDLKSDEENLLMAWFWKFFGTGAISFPAAIPSFQEEIYKRNAAVGFLAFPEKLNGIPPVTFTKNMLMRLISYGPISGYYKACNDPISKIVEMRIDMMTDSELLSLQRWGRDSGLGYRIGNNIHEAISKRLIDEESWSIANVTAVVKTWKNFPDRALFDEDKELAIRFTLDAYRLLFTWTNVNFEADVMQSFERFLNKLGDPELVFLKNSIPTARPVISNLLNQNYARIHPGHKEIPPFQDIIKTFLAPIDVVKHARQPYDHQHIAMLKPRFITTLGFAHPSADDIWKMVRFWPDNDVWQYLFLLRVYSNVPFGWMEWARTVKGIRLADMDRYIQANVTKPTLQQLKK